MDDRPSNRLRVRRAEVRITQERLARKLSERTGRHWSQVRVHRIENELQAPSADERLDLAAALDTTVDELFPQPSAELAS